MRRHRLMRIHLPSVTSQSADGHQPRARSSQHLPQPKNGKPDCPLQPLQASVTLSCPLYLGGRSNLNITPISRRKVTGIDWDHVMLSPQGSPSCSQRTEGLASCFTLSGRVGEHDGARPAGPGLPGLDHPSDLGSVRPARLRRSYRAPDDAFRLPAPKIFILPPPPQSPRIDERVLLTQTVNGRLDRVNRPI